MSRYVNSTRVSDLLHLCPSAHFLGVFDPTGTGMICTANYEARKFGVRAGMPGFIALELCKNLVFVKSVHQCGVWSCASP